MSAMVFFGWQEERFRWNTAVAPSRDASVLRGCRLHGCVGTVKEHLASVIARGRQRREAGGGVGGPQPRPPSNPGGRASAHTEEQGDVPWNGGIQNKFPPGHQSINQSLYCYMAARRLDYTGRQIIEKIIYTVNCSKNNN